jgi:Arc/MetJ family transcription regulator
MRTNIELDPELVAAGLRFTKLKTKRELVHLALVELVENRQRKDLRELRGTGGVREDYDHRALRERQGGP